MFRVVHPAGLRRYTAFACFALAALAFAVPAMAQGEGKRVALVIGNNDYSGVPALKNAVNDARLIEKALGQANFRTVIVKVNATRNDMEDAFAEFVSKLGPDDTAFFFYAGHGLQIENENFLVPVDFQVMDTAIRSKARCFSITQWMDSLRRQNPKISIIVLDACRSNPVAGQLRLASGLATPTSQLNETKILYSTQPNMVAADNPNGRNSYFTEALADEISKPNLELAEIIRRVTKTVREETGEKQAPFDTGSLSTRFYFQNSGSQTDDDAIVLVQKYWEAAKLREQREDWDDAIELVNRLLGKKPTGRMLDIAKQKLVYLEARKQAQVLFENADFKAASVSYDQAYRLDKFAIDSAFQAVNSYLLNDKLDEAVGLLGEIRVRGNSDAFGKANAMLKALADVHPGAGKELQAGIPAPPPVGEIFTGVQFGVPDFDAGKRFLAETPVEVTRWSKEMAEAIPPQPVITAPVVAANTAHEPGDRAPNPNAFHIEVVPAPQPAGEGRNISIQSTGSGFLKLEGVDGSAEVAVNGVVKADKLPASLALPGGKYIIRAVEGGKTLSTQEIEVKPTSSNSVKITK